jgi:aromatic ring-cleaving dioxygenase
MKKNLFLISLFLLLSSFLNATVYFDGEDGTVGNWRIRAGSDENAELRNIYDATIGSRVIHLANGGIYELGGTGGAHSWNNREERILSWRMNYSGRYTIYVSVTTTNGHRWLFFNDLNVFVGHHGTGILGGLGDRQQSHNGEWHTVTVDLDRHLRDTEPNNEIISVNGVRFGGQGGLVDNIILYTPTRTTYEDGNHGTEAWQVVDNEPNGATVSVIHDDEVVHLRGRVREPEVVPPIDYAYDDDVISLQGDGENNAYRIGDIDGANAWHNTTQTTLQWKMRNSNRFRLIVHVDTINGARDLIYTPDTHDQGISDNGLEIHHGLGRSRNGDDVAYGQGTDSRWMTYTRDLLDDLHDYDPNNQLVAINGITIQGNTLIDDIALLSSIADNYTYPTFATYTDAEDGTLGGWHMRDGSAINGRIVNLFDEEIDSHVIEFRGGNSYSLGANSGDMAWNNQRHKMIAWRMRTNNNCQIIVHVNTTDGLRHLFYTTVSYNRGLYHGFTGGIHHGIGGHADGRWRTVTRDLAQDLHDADPTNQLLSINGITINGGDGMRLDDLVLFTPIERIYSTGDSTDGWQISDNDPNGATIATIADNDRQGRHLQGSVIQLQGAGADNAYRLDGINNSTQKILQWRFRDFGDVEVLGADPDERGTIRDPNAFAFRVHVQTTEGARDLLYTLGSSNQGLIENGATIHHALGDDRTRGSVWEGDEPLRMNELGLWQTITRDLEKDIRDFEPENSLVRVDSFEVRNSGLIDDVKMLSNAIVYDLVVADPFTMYEDAEDGNTNGWSIFANDPEGATITNVTDPQRTGRVIELSGSGRSNGYMLGARAGENAWGDVDKKIIRWSMNYNEGFTIYIVAQTTNGRRYFTYTPQDDNRGLRGEYVLIGLGEEVANGEWHTFTRDLEADLHLFEADNEIIAIDAFMVRGSGRFDDIQTLNAMDLPIDDKIRPIITLNGEQQIVVHIGDAYEDAGALAMDNIDGDITNRIVTQSNLNTNIAGTYHITYNVVDNADNQALEVVRTVIVVEENSVAHVYEDAEDGNTNGWSIFANDPEGAVIRNVVDDQRDSRVIELQGTGKSNGYMLGARVGEERWNDTEHHTIRWSMNYNEDFTIYIVARTTNGRRYFTYTPREDDRGLRGSYLLIGLGEEASNGEWHTFTRDLEADLHLFDADNEIIAIDAFMVRGSGRFDDIQILD